MNLHLGAKLLIMKKINLFLILVLCFSVNVSVQAQETIKPSGTLAVMDYDFTDFTEVSISDDFKGYITQSAAAESVTLKVDDNLVRYIRVKKVGKRLEISFKANVNIKGEERLEAHISIRNLEVLKGAADAEIYLKNQLIAPKLSLELSGDSFLKGEVDVKQMSASLRGDSYMKVKGEIDELEKYECVVKHLDVKLNGDSECYLTVTKSLNAVVKGDSVLSYKGDAVVEEKKVGEDSEFVKAD